jgi:hypothetical protein
MELSWAISQPGEIAGERKRADVFNHQIYRYGDVANDSDINTQPEATSLVL